MLRPILSMVVLGFFQFTVRYPAATLVLCSASRESTIADVIASFVLAVVASEMVWQAALARRDTSALTHLRQVAEKGGNIEMFRIHDYIPKFKTRAKYLILNMSAYKTYATIQFAHFSSYIIVPFRPGAQNPLRTLWLLHECGHIGPNNRARSLHLEIGKTLSMALMGPAIFLAYPGPWLLLLIVVGGGYLAAVSTLNGRLAAEIEADHFALRAALELGHSESILELSRVSPPPDRNLDQDANRLRRASFDAMLTDLRLHRKLAPIYKYIGSETLFREIRYGWMLVVFCVGVGLFLPVHASVSGVSLLFLAMSSLTFVIFFRERRVRAREVRQLVVQRSLTTCG